MQIVKNTTILFDPFFGMFKKMFIFAAVYIY